MKNKLLACLGIAALLLTTGCSGLRESQNTFVAHGECFRIFGFAIPEDDQQAALDRVPAGATITTVGASPADWTSVIGFFGNLFGFHQTSISGVKK
jgi:hypothetical protein